MQWCWTAIELWLNMSWNRVKAIRYQSSRVQPLASWLVQAPWPGKDGATERMIKAAELSRFVDSTGHDRATFNNAGSAQRRRTLSRDLSQLDGTHWRLRAARQLEPLWTSSLHDVVWVVIVAAADCSWCAMLSDRCGCSISSRAEGWAVGSLSPAYDDIIQCFTSRVNDFSHLLNCCFSFAVWVACSVCCNCDAA